MILPYIILPCLRLNPVSEKFPVTLPHDPDAEQKIGDGMGGHRVTQPVFADDQPLVGEAAEDAGEPLLMGNAEDDGGHEKGGDVKLAQGHFRKLIRTK